MSRFFQLVVGIGILLFGSLSWAQSDSDVLDLSIRQDFMSARALGMGNAYVAMADDYNTLMINPAGLARLDTWQLNMSMDYAIGADIQSFVSEIQNASGSDSTQLYDVFDSFNGQSFHVRTIPASGFLVRPGWGIAVVPVDLSATFAVQGQGANLAVPPILDASIYMDTTIATGFARDAKIGNGRFSWGVTGKVIHRVEMSRSYNPLDFAEEDTTIYNEEDANEGLTVDADIGTLWTPKLPGYGLWRTFKLARPTFGAVVRNVVGTGFFHSFNTLSSNSGKPVQLYRTLDLGSRWEYPKMWIFRSRGLMDIRDIGHPNWSLRKGIHIGWELNWKMYDWWKGAYRFGINQGYATFGLSARLGIWNLDFATWGEEIGTQSTTKENRRFMLKFNIEI